MPSAFIGYATVEEWCKANAAAGTAYLFPSRQSQPYPGTSLGDCEYRLTLSCFDAGQPDRVHYVRLPLGRVSTNAGRPLDADDARRASERLAEAARLVRDWLAERAFVVFEGSVAVPRDLPLLDGWADFLVFDEAVGAVRRKDPEPATSAAGDGEQADPFDSLP